ncbi:MAG: N-acetyl-gamma-glutamyl-phosphate reductase [Verrucomicrobiota bacterium]
MSEYVGAVCPAVMSDTVKVGVVGASGYTGEELLRILSRHPAVEVTTMTSRQLAGQDVRKISGIGAHLHGMTFEDLRPSEVAQRAEVFFLALPHGVAAEYALPLLQAGKKVIDLSADFRLNDAAVYQEFYGMEHPAPEMLAQAVYALPELHRDDFSKFDLFACPGCYPTSINLPLAPLLQAGFIESEGIVINSLSGVSGAGKQADLMYSFCERDNNAAAYSWPKHRHLAEMEQELSVHAGKMLVLTFTPHLLPVVRGMLSTISARLKADVTEEKARELLENTYAQEAFVQVLPADETPEIKHVVGSNQCLIAVRVDTRAGRLQVVSVIDNLLKGASGQAVQVFNAISGLDESTGL